MPMFPIIQVEYDLSTIDDFDSPSEYFKEEAALQSIIRAGLRRQYRREMAVDFGASQASLQPPSQDNHRPQSVPRLYHLRRLMPLRAIIHPHCLCSLS
ncbi:hypothetical protein HGRIS_000670 [Hohenbuehelia grisea]|uniref:Uncharacterized protein n=1 Tax=Hohenbuehelia grisea TaxID=104357 RepID=A0ABR3JRV6_9AGAR